MTTGQEIKALRTRYTQQEWTHMTGQVSPLVVSPPLRGGLDTENGLVARATIITEMSCELPFMGAFMQRLRRDFDDVEEWAIDFMEELEQGAVQLEGSAVKATVDVMCDAMARSHTHALRVAEGDIRNGARIYGYYLEDLFDDVVRATEWQVKAMEE